ncbi:hypothetical protein WG915_03400 [Corynebacterium sp. H128]|uniref:hypothetical protein n=1 Tax=unclassified Corynebacterium TaxID=2624378 RepID=UPI0030A20DEA
MKKHIGLAVALLAFLAGAPTAAAYEVPRHPSEIAREQAKTPIERLQDQALMSTMQASFLGMAVPDAIAAGNPGVFGPLGQCVQQVSGSAEIQPVQMVATWGCLVMNPSLNTLPRWYM